MLRVALNVSWKQHMTNEELYGDLLKVTSKIAMHRLRLAGHCVRHHEEIASSWCYGILYMAILVEEEGKLTSLMS